MPCLVTDKQPWAHTVYMYVLYDLHVGQQLEESMYLLLVDIPHCLHEGCPSWFEEGVLKAVLVSLRHIFEVPL